MKRYLGISVLFMMGLSVVFVGNSSATTVERMSVERMSADAGLIVEGVVQKNESKWDETGRMIITETTVAVTSSLKGRADPTIVVRTLGGELPDVGMFVAGAPRFKVGDAALLILERHPTRDWRVMGLYQGKFDVRPDPKTGQAMAINASSEFSAPLTDLRERIKASTGSRP